ncbi:hypothetical protein K438DRAFT_1762557 [Mycena galopus ATCC 62051]|nr:hypothetical protein K438DRAFT_1762557 [Mycena galopus ATCC 62051]
MGNPDRSAASLIPKWILENQNTYFAAPCENLIHYLESASRENSLPYEFEETQNLILPQLFPGCLYSKDALESAMDRIIYGHMDRFNDEAPNNWRDGVTLDALWQLLRHTGEFHDEPLWPSLQISTTILNIMHHLPFSSASAAVIPLIKHKILHHLCRGSSDGAMEDHLQTYHHDILPAETATSITDELRNILSQGNLVLFTDIMMARCNSNVVPQRITETVRQITPFSLQTAIHSDHQIRFAKSIEALSDVSPVLLHEVIDLNVWAVYAPNSHIIRINLQLYPWLDDRVARQIIQNSFLRYQTQFTATAPPKIQLQVKEILNGLDLLHSASDGLGENTTSDSEPAEELTDAAALAGTTSCTPIVRVLCPISEAHRAPSSYQRRPGGLVDTAGDEGGDAGTSFFAGEKGELKCKMMAGEGGSDCKGEEIEEGLEGSLEEGDGGVHVKDELISEGGDEGRKESGEGRSRRVRGKRKTGKGEGNSEGEEAWLAFPETWQIAAPTAWHGDSFIAERGAKGELRRWSTVVDRSRASGNPQGRSKA